MNVVDEVKERLDLTDFISQHVHLEKSGRYFKGLCPFHTEKTPSFFVFPDSQRWHCFGCNRGGDIYNFVMELDGLDFRTALEDLARQAGVPLRPQTPQEKKAQSERERLQALVEAAAKYYHTLLMTSPQAEPARQYLKGRGFSRETVETFQIGYSMDSWDALRTHLSGQGFTIDEQVKAGMLVQRDDGRTYDRFRHRVMIPIHDRRGRPIAFGGRVLSAEDQPKYMNSPQTPLFDKSQVLFGYHEATGAIRDADAAVIVEGYMDVMIPHQAGFKNVVAPMGTALSEAHLNQLQRLTNRFILALDPDSAGIHGTIQGMETARKTLDREQDVVFDPRGMVGVGGRLKADIRVVVLPDGLDPDEIVLQDPGRWAELIKSSQPIVRFFFQHIMSEGDPGEPRRKSEIVDAMLPLLNDLPDRIEREAYVQEIARQLALDPRPLLDRLRAMEHAEAVKAQRAAQRRAPVARSRRDMLPSPEPGASGGRDNRSTTRTVSDLQAHVLIVLMHYPELLARVNELLDTLGDAPINLPLGEDDFSGQHRLIWTALQELKAHPELELEDLLPSDILSVVQDWMAKGLPDASISQWERQLLLTILRIRKRKCREDKERTDSLLIEASVTGDREMAASLGSRVVELSGRLLKLDQALAQRPV